MKFIVSVLLTAILSVAACFYLPWWSIAFAAFAVAALVAQKPLAAFLSGFTALFLLWGVLSWYISHNNEHRLAHKISLLLLNADSPMILVLATALIGALVAGFAALTGSFLRNA